MSIANPMEQLDAQRRLSEVLSEFARTLVTDFPIQGILDHLVERIVDVLPISAAGVTLISPGSGPRYVAASDESALRFERLQTELGEGPCLVAYRSGGAVAVPDLRVDDQFPRFGPRAVEGGLVAVFTFPLRADDRRLGALDLYRTSAGPLDPEAMTAAQTLANVAAAYLLNAQTRVELKASTERSRQIAMHDTLTGLPNRTLLLDRLGQAMSRCRRNGKMTGILFTDLDSFKPVNDNFGHHVGDALLVAVTERLVGLMRKGDTVARLSGDEFVMLCEDLDVESNAEPLASRIVTALGEPFVLSGGTMSVTASVGIAFGGRHGEVPEQVLRDADTAMYQVKRNGGARYGIIDRDEQRRDDRRMALDRDLRHAQANGELRLDYQPIVATSDGRITGVEALLRWVHPTRGIIGPDIVIPLAEQYGLIGEIGQWVLERACMDSHLWPPNAGHDLDIAVNVSAQQLLVPDFAASVQRVLADTGTDPAVLTLEITESVPVHGSDCFAVLDELKRLGVRLALDDFGTGYSSLSYLKRLPVDVVKIDRMFLVDLETDPATRVIVAAIVELAHGLHLQVTVEGIESAAQHRRIAALGCQSCQGNHFASPMPASDFGVLMATRSTAVPEAKPGSS